MLLTDADLADSLRARAGDSLRIFRTAAAMFADAIDIADSTARSDIECHFLRSADGWYNLALIPDESFSDWLPQIESYLTARGMIERHPENANLVRFVKRA